MSRRGKPIQQRQPAQPATSRPPSVALYQQNTQVNLIQGSALDPELIERLKSVKPEYADLVMEKWAKQVDHRHEMELCQIQHPFELRKRGQLFGFFAATLIVLAGLYLLYLGKIPEAMVAFGTVAVSLAGAFYVERYIGVGAKSEQVARKK